MGTDQGPRCPGCGYPIFGLRDMRCPECGRTLDVRDFALGDEGAEERRTKVTRDGLIGGLIASFFFLIFVALAWLFTGAALRRNVMPLCCGAFLVLGMIALGYTLRGVGQDARDLRKRRWKKRAGDD